MSDVLREYLVSLGFTINESDWRKFTTGVARAHAGVKELGTEAVATGLAISAMVEMIARRYEDLYYISQRTGSTVSNLQAAGFAAKQVGLSVESIQGAIEQFAMAQRMNPGIAGLVRQFSTATDKTEQFVETVEKLQAMPFFQAARVAGLFGIDPQTLLMLFLNLKKFKESMVENKRIVGEAGLDVDDFAKKSVALGNAIDHLAETFSVLRTRIAADLIEPVQAGVKALDDLLQMFNRFNKETEGKAGVAGTLIGTGLGAILAKRLLWRLFGFGGAVGGAGATAGGAAAAAGGGIMSTLLRWGAGPIGMLLGSTSAAEGGPDLMMFDKKTGKWVPIPGRGGEATTPVELPPKPAGAKEQGRFSGGVFGGMPGWGKDEKPIGWTLEKATKMGMPDFITPLAKMAWEFMKIPGDAMRGKYAHQPSTPGMWSEEDEFIARRKAGREITDALRLSGWGLNPSGGAMRNLMPEFIPGSLARFNEGRGAGGLSGADFQGRFSGDLVPASGGSPSVNLNQRTEIVVGSGPTALATAQAVMDGQRNVNSDAVRNFRPVIR